MTRTMIFVMLLGACALAGAAVAEDAAPKAAAPSVDAGMRVYIDPETGEFAPAPPADPGSAGAQARTSAAEPELVEEANPAGGYTVRLHRQFQAVTRAKATSTGTEVHCETGPAEAAK